jgi:predicted AAA+ superfamily ATPase
VNRWRESRSQAVRTPKLNFLDTGLATWLLGIQHMEQLITPVQRGALFETWVSGACVTGREAIPLPGV